MASKRKTRLYEPWGYRDQDNYQSVENRMEDDFNSFFAGVQYKKEDNKIHFSNNDGKEVATLDVSEFVKSDTIVEKTWYENGKIYIKFTNGDLITIDVKELIDENEFADGLQVNDGVVSVLIDNATEKWLTVSENGIKVSGIQREIDNLDEKNETEKNRAISAETALSEKISEISGYSEEKIEELFNRLGYKDNDTLVLTNEHEVAFGEYNVSNTSEDPSGQTVFSVGIGTSDEDRKNAIEVRKDGTVFMWIENDFIAINNLIGMLAHEIY